MTKRKKEITQRKDSEIMKKLAQTERGREVVDRAKNRERLTPEFALELRSEYGRAKDKIKVAEFEDNDPARGSAMGTLTICEPILDDLIATGANFKTTQSNRAKKSRGRITSDGRSFNLSDEIAHLAAKRDSLGDPLAARDLWGDLFSILEGAHLDPKESGDAYTYRKNSEKKVRRSLSFSTFKSMVSQARKS